LARSELTLRFGAADLGRCFGETQAQCRVVELGDALAGRESRTDLGDFDHAARCRRGDARSVARRELTSSQLQ